MLISSVEVRLVDVPPPEPQFHWRSGLPSSPRVVTSGGVLRIATEDGNVGEAYCVRGPILSDIVDRVLRDALIGKDASLREWLWHLVWEVDRIEELPIYVLGVVDVALWDMAGRLHGVPAYELMGGYRREIPAYASTSTFGDVSEFLDVADQCVALGYKAIKLHAWGDARADAELCIRLREHVGDSIDLMYDGSAGFDLADAVFLGDAIASAGYRWYEEPMREASIGAYEALAKRTRVPLLVAETSDGSHYNAADFIRSGCATYVRTSSMYKGGFTGALRTAHLAEAHMLRAEVHAPGIESQHLCMSIPSCTYYESLVTSNPVRRELSVTDEGLVLAPEGPGVDLPEFARL